jgi:hypothetical protein
MDLRGDHAPSVHAAAIEISRLAVAAEGPGAPFTATHRGQQLLRLIHIVVQNVGLEDKVGALTALRLLKADDTLLQKLLKAGVLPSLLDIIRRDGEKSSTDGDEAAAEAAAAAARAVQAFASSGDVLTTLLRGGAVQVLSGYVCRRGGEVARDSDHNNDADSTEASKRRMNAAKSCAVAMARVSGSYLTDLDEHAAFDNVGPFPGVSPLDPAAASGALSTARSLLALLESDLTVSHREACAGIERLASSGRAGRAAACQVGCVLPLMTAALAGNPKQRQSALEAMETLTLGTRDGSLAKSRTDDGVGGNKRSADAVGCDDDADVPMDMDADMDADMGGGGVGDPREIAARAEAQITASHRTQKERVQTAGYTDLSATTLGVIGTAAKVGETFFGRLVAILGELLDLRGAAGEGRGGCLVGAVGAGVAAVQSSRRGAGGHRAAREAVRRGPRCRRGRRGRRALRAGEDGCERAGDHRGHRTARRGFGRYLLEKEEELESPKAGGNTSADNFFKRMNSAQNSGIGPSRLSVEHPGASPGLSRCIKGQYN